MSEGKERVDVCRSLLHTFVNGEPIFGGGLKGIKTAARQGSRVEGGETHFHCMQGCFLPALQASCT